MDRSDQSFGHRLDDKVNAIHHLSYRRCAYMEKRLFGKMSRVGFIWTLILLFQVIFSCLATGVSILNLGARVYIETNYGVSIDVALVMFNIAGTILTTLAITFKFSKTIELLKYGVTKFSKMIRTIEQVVNSATSRRPDATEFLETLNEKYYKYHNSGRLLVKEMMNFHNIRQRVSSASR